DFHVTGVQTCALPISLIIIALLIGLVRPVLKSLIGSGSGARSREEARELAALRAAGIDSFDSLSHDTVTLTGGDALALPRPEEEIGRESCRERVEVVE